MPFWSSSKKTKIKNKVPLVKATFGAGCYWKLELYFQQTFGVCETRVGFAKGKTTNPRLKKKVEVVEVLYDPRKVSYETLLTAFWDYHDATIRQSPEHRSVILGHNTQQVNAALASKVKYHWPEYQFVQTEISLFRSFSPSLFYHQQYFRKRLSIDKQYPISKEY